MENLKPNNKKALIEIFKVISWLDDKRWKQDIERPDIFVEEILKLNTLLALFQERHWLQPVDELEPY